MQMNGNITIDQVSEEDYLQEGVGFKLNPLIEPFWIESFRDASKIPMYFVFRNDNKTIGLAGGLAVALGPKALHSFSRYLYLYAIPLITYDNTHLIIEHFKEYLKRSGFNRLLVGSSNSLYTYDLKKCGFKIRQRDEYFLDLSQPLKSLWAKLSKGQKWAINKARKNGLIFNIDRGSHKLNDLVGCLEHTRFHKASKGFGNYNYFSMPFMTKSSITHLLNTDNAFISTVSHKDTNLSSSLIMGTNIYRYYLLAGSNGEGYKLNASTYMLWRIIEEAKEAGCEVLNLGGLPHDATAAKLAQFKRSFGAERRLCEAGLCDLHQGPRRLLHKYYIIPVLFLSRLMSRHR